MNSSFGLAFAPDKWLNPPTLTSLTENVSLFKAVGSSLEVPASVQLKIKVCVH